MTQLGMDVEIVEDVAHTLQQRAQQIEGVVHGLDKTVNSLAGVWDGPDATAFVTHWWPEHRKLLMKASADVNGLASSVLHNADEQRQASLQKSGMGDPTPAGAQPFSGRAEAFAPAAAAAAAASVAAGMAGAPAVDPHGALQPPATQDAFNSRANDYGDLGPGQGNDGECTSWVAFRRRQLGLDCPAAGKGLNGGQWAEHMTQKLVEPQAGAVGSFENHTFIVESVNPGPPKSITISEMNNSYLGGKGKMDTDTYSYVASSGLWKSPNQRAPKFMEFGT